MTEREVQHYHFDWRKTWSFMIMLVVMIAIGLARLWTHGLAEEWGIAVILVALPGMALLMVGQELRLKAPVLVISEDGILDRRRGSDVLPWSAIQEATVKRRTFNQGIRIVLTNGDRYDIELGLIAADPADIMRHIQEQAARHAGVLSA